jgi:peptidyl-prolyl cis-trans isomerase C
MLAEPDPAATDDALARRKSAVLERVLPALETDPVDDEPHRKAADDAARKILDGFRRVLRDPLTAFALIGLACFALYAVIHSGRQTIDVSKAAQVSLAQDFELLTGRAPTAADKKKLVDDYIADEVLFRVALDRNMHLTDNQTKRRLIDKLRFMVTGAPVEPTEEDLIDYYAMNTGLYRSEPKLTFDHVFFEQAPADPAAVLARLDHGEPVTGDEFWMGGHFDAYGQSMVRGMLGQPFVSALKAAPVGRWTGPVKSMRGVHFVRLGGLSGEALMPYTAVREQIRQDWMAQRTNAILDKEVSKFKESYNVKIEP